MNRLDILSMESIEKILGYWLCLNVKSKIIQSIIDAVVLFGIGLVCDFFLSFYFCLLIDYEGAFGEIYWHIFITYFMLVVLIEILNYKHKDRLVLNKILNLVIYIDILTNDKNVKNKIKKILLGDFCLFMTVLGIVIYGFSIESFGDKLIKSGDNSLYMLIIYIFVTLVYVIYGNISFIERDIKRRKLWVNTVATILWFAILSYRIHIYVDGAQSEIQYIDAGLLVFSAFFIIPNIEKDLDYIKSVFVELFSQDVCRKRKELLEYCGKRCDDTRNRMTLVKENLNRFTKVYKRRWKNGERKRVIIDVIIMVIIVATVLICYIVLIKIFDYIFKWVGSTI